MRKVDWWKVSIVVADAVTAIMFGIIVMTSVFGAWGGAMVGLQDQGTALLCTVVLGSPFWHPFWWFVAGVIIVFEQIVLLSLLYCVAMTSMDVTGHDFFPFQAFWTCVMLFEPVTLFVFGVFCAEHQRYLWSDR